ncbi:hypothetical protein [Nocardia vermiculata]|uniref:hypothetical protein n=1 Tax=Nocardia vermiculata TaxID=257274 RepID=UPI00082CB4A4|nr:hypothetical protein [Nocardia vermiculata]
MQQVAGAAGTALFVTMMTRGTESALGEGTAPIGAAAHGVHTAFLVAAVLSVVLIAAAAMVRSPKEAVGSAA